MNLFTSGPFLKDLERKAKGLIACPRMPAVSIHECAGAVIVHIPGLIDGHVHVEFKDGLLIIHGQRRMKNGEGPGSVRRPGLFCGPFLRVIPLSAETTGEVLNFDTRLDVLEIKLGKTMAVEV